MQLFNSIFKEVVLLEALNLNINIDDFFSFCVVVNHLSFVWLCMLVIIDGDFICCLPSYGNLPSSYPCSLHIPYTWHLSLA